MFKRCANIILILLLFLPLSFSADLECRYNSNPYIREKIPYAWDERNMISWLCNITDTKDKSYDCMSYVYFGNDTIQSNPDPEYIKGVGVVDSFVPQPANASTQILNVYFTNKDLRDDRWVMFSVLCSDGNATLSYEQNITPQYKDAYQSYDVAEYGQSNAGYFLGFAFLIIFIITIGGLLWRLTTG